MGDIVQYVQFTTSLALPGFRAYWDPIAASFLQRGAGRIVLAEAIDRRPGVTLDFVSRTWWPEAAFAHTFPGGRLPPAVASPKAVVGQAGAFHLWQNRLRSVDQRQAVGPGLGKIIALIQGREADATVIALLKTGHTGRLAQTIVYQALGDSKRQPVRYVIELYCPAEAVLFLWHDVHSRLDSESIAAVCRDVVNLPTEGAVR